MVRFSIRPEYLRALALATVLGLAVIAGVRQTLGSEAEAGLPAAPIAESEEAKLLADGRFVYLPEAFTLEPDDSWTDISPAVAELPAAFGEAEFVFRRAPSGCSVAYTLAPRTWEESYEITSVGTRVYLADVPFGARQIDSRLHAPKASLPEGFSLNFFLDDPKARRPFDGDVWVGEYYEGEGTFLIFDEGGTPVSADCEAAGVELLATLAPLVTDGLVPRVGEYWLSANDGLVSYESGDRRGTVTVTEDDTESGWVVRNGKLLGARKGVVWSVDVFSGEQEALPNLSFSGSAVNDFAVFGDRVYLLVGVFCNGYMERCDNALYLYHFSTGQLERLVASGLKSRSIISLDDDRNLVFLARGEGDAGCSWGSGEIYDLAAGTLRGGGSYSHCYNEDTGEVSRNADTYVEPTGVTPRHSDGLIARDGALLPVPGPTDGTFSFAAE